MTEGEAPGITEIGRFIHRNSGNVVFGADAAAGQNGKFVAGRSLKGRRSVFWVTLRFLFL